MLDLMGDEINEHAAHAGTLGFGVAHLLDGAFGADHFPIDIPMIAQEYSEQRFLTTRSST